MSITYKQALYATATAIGLMAAFYLLTRHTAHAFGVLPYLLILACPLMHLLRHRHGHHSRDVEQSAKQAPPLSRP